MLVDHTVIDCKVSANYFPIGTMSLILFSERKKERNR